MNVLVVFLALAWPGEVAVAAAPVVIGQAEAMEEHDHDHAHGEEAFAGDEHFHEAAPPRQSYLQWLFMSLGVRYTLLFLLTGPLVFLGSLLVVAMCKRPGPIAAFFPFVFIPFLIGIYGFFDGAIMGFSVIANSPVTPKPSEIAMGISTSLVTPLVGLFLMAPSFLILSVGLFARSLTYRGEGKEGVYK